MKTHAPLLFITFTLAWLAPAEAQLFNRKPKTPAPQRVGELIVQAKSDQDERKRAAAAAELRDFDGRAHPEIVPVLVDIARTDSKASVRLEAISSLARVRPISQDAGQALEWAATHDESWKVRFQAKSSLTRYQWAGYGNNRKESPTPNINLPPSTQEPPVINSRVPSTNPPPIVRTTPKTPAAAPSSAPQAQPPVVVTTIKPKQAPAATASKPNLAPTPPPIIVESPSPKKSEPALQPGAPVVPKTAGSSAPAPLPVGVPAATSEPNFRPAGQAPPRFSTAVPQAPSVAPSAPLPPIPPVPPPPKAGDSGPVLTPPM
jgi:hypothetical protein